MSADRKPRTYRRRTTIGGQFAPRRIEMLESPAYRALSLSARRIIDRIEIELAHHGGRDNGKLPVTYEDLIAYGVHKDACAPGLREVQALGFIECTERGRAGNAEFRTASKYRATFRDTDRAKPTDEWKRIATIEQAEAIAKAARKGEHHGSRDAHQPQRSARFSRRFWHACPSA